jgi:hypothetical protein
MKCLAIIGLATALTSISAHAEDAKPLTIEQCINILGGLNSLSYAGQQLNDASKPPADAKQYKLGPARMTVALNISALSPVLTAARTAQGGFLRELPPLPEADAKNPSSAAARDDAAAALNKKAAENWQIIIGKPCNVTPAHLRASELKIGDGPDENAFPVPVLGAIWPIVDR